MQKSVLITGCSSGIGNETALQLHQRGYRVIATGRRLEDLHALQHQGITCLVMDLDKSESIQTSFQEVLQITNQQLDVLINNAGFGQTGALEDLSRENLKAQFETNVFGLMELTSLVIPVMRQQGHGRIINISSILGLVAMPFRGAYNASKHALEGLSNTLRLELKASGIKVISIQPGPIRSRFRDNAIAKSLKNINIENSFFHEQYAYMLNHFRTQKEDFIFTCSPEAVIAKIMKAIEKKHPRAHYRVTIPAHLLANLKRLLPVILFDKLMAFVSRKELGQ